MKVEGCKQTCSAVERRGVRGAEGGREGRRGEERKGERERDRKRKRQLICSSSVTSYLGAWMGTKRATCLSLALLSFWGCVPPAGRRLYTSCTPQPSASRNCRTPLPRSQPFPLETCPLGTNICTPSSNMNASPPSTAAWAAAGGHV